MDPVGPWYAPYNRLAAAAGAAAAGAGAAAPAADLHHLAAAAAATTTAAAAAAAGPPTSTAAAQLLPGGFLSPPPPVAYDAVFSPLFHHGAKPAAAHYVSQVTQHRAQALAAAASSKQSGDGEFHAAPAQAFFEQGAAGAAWQQNSPFGILPHESVVATTTGKAGAYENFNAHFAAAQSLNNHINSQLAANSKTGANRAQSPQVSTASAKSNASQPNSSTFFQVPVTMPEGGNTTKTFTSANTSNLQQSCIVSSPSTTKEYRVPQAPPARAFLSSPNNPSRSIEKTFASPPAKQQAPPQIQTKAQTKIYSELRSQQERSQQQQGGSEENASQSSPISFSIMDAPGRLNYSGSNSSGKRPPQFQQNYRHYQQQQPSSNSEEFQRPKSGPEYQQQNNSNGADCGNVVVPRRPSPLQAHSQASPLGHAQSPAYPMYHSPMSSMPSPQQQQQQQQQQNSGNPQVAPQSPLDVSVPRPNSQAGGGAVAYPSVITRALNSDKTYPERYERPNHQSNCWDDRQQSRKYPQAQQSNSYGSSIEMPARQEGQAQQQQQQQQRQYFDGNHGAQVLQDLSSCRGDPMSIVKNLQQQQSCQVQQAEVKQPAKRRKSVEKVAAAQPQAQAQQQQQQQPPPPAPEVHMPSRVPPPAHTSAANQQQQNGVYFDFDRWNLPPPASKIFASQAALHQQHQGLMVPHPHGHHPPPPIPYFAPFHLANHPAAAEFPSTVELTPLTTYNEQQAAAAAAAAAAAQAHTAGHYQQQAQQAQAAAQQQQEDQPKVVVPNIEEELNFLSGDTTPRPQMMGPQHPKPPQPPQQPNVKPPDVKPTGPGAGFMSSYLKFLQGERDASPPPAVRGSRKPGSSSWARKPDGGKTAETNGVPPVAPQVTVPTVPPPMPVMRLSTQGDPQDDPRYFPLPKERKRGFDSSDDGFSSDDDFFGSKKNPLPPISEKETKKKTSKKSKNGGPSDKKKQKMQDKLLKQQQREEKQREKEKMKEAKKLENVPKREQKKREAKGKNSLSDIIKEENEADEPPEFQDSEDSDPAWTPAAVNSDEDCLPMKKKGRGRQTKSKKGVKNLIAAAAQGAGITVSETSPPEKKKLTPKKQNVPTLEDNIAASLPNSFSTYSDDNLSKPGEFVAIKSELNQEWPAIWRVDGKTLLQKYEPFEQNGVTLYRNISTYTSWTPESKKQYVSVPVIVRSQGQLETIVEFLKHEMNVIDHEFHERCMKQCESYQDNFEVYIQTLISQALDSNFLMEIFQEKDEYFLSNVQTIDEITEGRKRKLLAAVGWPQAVRVAVCTWPCYNVIRDVGPADREDRACAACGKDSVAVRVLMYGQPYNATTLEGCQPDPAVVMEKDFFMCRLCASRVELASKVIHQKYLMYIECAKRVSEKRTSDPTKDTTCILNELLADENWLNQLFLDVRSLWAEIDSIEHSFKMKESVCAQ